MAEHDLRPIEIDEDIQGTYELLRGYFIRPNNQFNIVADYVNDDTFSIDLIRSYSVIASTHRAAIHVSGTPIEGGTRVSFHVKSVENKENLEKEISDRIEEALGHILAEKRDTPIDDKDAERDPNEEKKQLIIVGIVAAVIAIGGGLTAVLQQYSGWWLV